MLKGHDGQDGTFQVAQNARVRVNNKEGNLSALKEGDHAVVGYTKQGDQLQAREVIAEPESQARGWRPARSSASRLTATRSC